MTAFVDLIAFDAQAHDLADADDPNVGLAIRVARDVGTAENVPVFAIDEGQNRLMTESLNNNGALINIVPFRRTAGYEFFLKTLGFSPASEFDINDFTHSGEGEFDLDCPNLDLPSRLPNEDFPFPNALGAPQGTNPETNEAFLSIMTCEVHRDGLVEGAETLQLQIGYAHARDDPVTHTVLSQEVEVYDTSHATLTFDAPSTVKEGEALELTFSLSSRAAFDLYAHWEVTFPDTTAEYAGASDFASVVGSARIPAGQRTFTVPVTQVIHESNLIEQTEGFEVRIVDVYEDMARTTRVRQECVQNDPANEDNVVRLRRCVAFSGTAQSVDLLQFNDPVVNGNHVENGMLRTDPMFIVDEQGDRVSVSSYRWERADDGMGTGVATISGATSDAYQLVRRDVGKYVRVATILASPAETRNSAWILVENSPASGKPVITGDLEVGRTLTAGRGTVADVNGLPADADLAYVWSRVDRDGTSNLVEGIHTGASYTLQPADGGKRIRVELSFTDLAGTEESRVGDPYPDPGSSTPRTVQAPATGTLTITGDATVGQDLMAAMSNFSDPNGLTSPTYTYQWQRLNADGTSPTDIGANRNIYHLVDEDVGMRIRVLVRFNDNDRYSEMLTSENTAIVNAPATGAPTITIGGAAAVSAKVDQVLMAATGGIADLNGKPSSFTYQWRRVDADGSSNPVDIGTGAEYTVVQADIQMRILVEVGFNDNDGFPESRVSSSLPIARADNREATGAPIIEGTFKVGNALRALAPPGAIDDPDGLTSPTYTYRWQRGEDAADPGWTNILDASQMSYTLATADRFKKIRVLFSFDDDRGNPEQRPSAAYPSATIEPIDNIPATGAPLVAGVAQVDRDLIARPAIGESGGIADGNGIRRAMFSYQWQREDANAPSGYADISGSNTNTYTAAKEDEGSRLRVVVTFTDEDRYSETLPSAPTDVVVRRDNIPAAGRPMVSGTVMVDSTLTVETSRITDQNGPGPGDFTYQWLRSEGPTAADINNATAIVGAVSETYTVVLEDERKHLAVRVSFTDGDGYPETLTSEATARVERESRDRESRVLSHFLSGFSYSAATALVDTVWRRLKSNRNAEVEPYANLGGRSLDAGSFASGSMSRAALEAARFLGVEIEPASKAGYGEEQSGTVVNGDAKAYRRWAGLPGRSGLAGRSAFALPLTGASGGGSSVVVWGAGDIRSFKSASDRWEDLSFSLDGKMTGGSIGLDRRVDNTLIGLIVTGSEGEANFAFDDAVFGKGTANVSLTSIAPWIGWRSPVGTELWAAAGSGVGEADVKNDSGIQAETDIKYNVVAAGFRGVARDYQGTKAAAKADAFVANSSTEQRKFLESVKSDVSRFRLALETSVQRMLESENRLEYSIEFGLRYDDGEAQSGSGMDILASLQYVNPGSGLSIRAHSSYLVQHQQDNYDEWALGGGVDWDPYIRDRGLQLSLAPTWNVAPPTGFAEAMWSETDGGIRDSQARGAVLLARLSYGADVLWKRALATAYGEMESSAEAKELRIGTELLQQETVMGMISMELYGERASGTSGSDSAVMLKTAIEF